MTIQVAIRWEHQLLPAPCSAKKGLHGKPKQRQDVQSKVVVQNHLKILYFDGPETFAVVLAGKGDSSVCKQLCEVQEGAASAGVSCTADI